MKALLFLIPLSLLMLNAEHLYNEDTNDTILTQESFLNSVEYGEMLYRNPRGISCQQCHGREGKGGQKIAKYYDKHKNPKLLKGVNIQNYSFSDLNASLSNQYRKKNRRKPHKVMPMYYLTEEEVTAIYNYLQQSRKKR